MGKTNGWNRYEKLVLSELASLKQAVISTQQSLVTHAAEEESNRITHLNALAKLATRLSVIEVKSGVWGAISGFVAAIPTAIGLGHFLKP